MRFESASTAPRAGWSGQGRRQPAWSRECWRWLEWSFLIRQVEEPVIRELAGKVETYRGHEAATASSPHAR